VVQALGQHHDARCSRVVLLDQRGDVDVDVSSVSPGRASVSHHRLGRIYTHEVVRSGRPLVLPRLDEPSRFARRAGLVSDAGAADTSFISVPIVYDGKAIGALSVELRYSPHRDYGRTATFLSVVGAMIAQAMKVHVLIE